MNTNSYGSANEQQPDTELKQFRIYWLHGETEVITGKDIVKAFTNAGYGAGAARAIDFYDHGSDVKYNRVGKEWVRNTPIFNPA